MRNFKDLEIWRLGHEMTLNIYKVIEPFPDDENYGLKAQMRRSAQSIPSNIAEGCGRDSVKELIRFCRIAMGSASELEYQLLLSKDLGYLNVKDYDTLENALLTLKKKLSAFLRYLKNQIPQ